MCPLGKSKILAEMPVLKDIFNFVAYGQFSKIFISSGDINFLKEVSSVFE